MTALENFLVCTCFKGGEGTKFGGRNEIQRWNFAGGGNFTGGIIGGGRAGMTGGGAEFYFIFDESPSENAPTKFCPLPKKKTPAGKMPRVFFLKIVLEF